MAIAGHARDLPTINEGLGSPDPAVRASALTAADRADALDLATLRTFLDDVDASVRYRAIQLAARRSDGVDLAKRLTEFLSKNGGRSDLEDSEVTSDADLAEVAAFALGELDLAGVPKQDAVRLLEEQALHHGDPLCREAAVAALGALGAGLETILAAAEDIATVRRRATLALAPFEGPEVDAALEAALGDRDWQVRQAAEDLVGPTDIGTTESQPPTADNG